jgi:hypothetical protein
MKQPDPLPRKKPLRTLRARRRTSHTVEDTKDPQSEPETTGSGRKEDAQLAWWGCSSDVDVIIRVTVYINQHAAQSGSGGAVERATASAPMREHRRLALHAGGGRGPLGLPVCPHAHCC